ncbi:unnamed protein product [Caenorhabditis auriculariae]|uniref:Reverse transcriptase/retrotransposon-derived protein RNase H-like domain-containing protein n=1 Tax=Caenorhabditis auriculariae TaxID=2777116 RepID=A0A8S1HPI6_9PELO|nr:unnamed protein product [Caenorhabditis auriculariae]
MVQKGILVPVEHAEWASAVVVVPKPGGKGVPGVIVYLDDITITAPSDEEHIKRLREVLKRIKDYGMITYYGKYIPNLSSESAPLNRLRQNDAEWVWGEKEQMAIDKIKKILVDSGTLAHYDPTEQIVLATDASDYGLEVEFFPAMSEAEEGYSQQSQTFSQSQSSTFDNPTTSSDTIFAAFNDAINYVNN